MSDFFGSGFDDIINELFQDDQNKIKKEISDIERSLANSKDREQQLEKLLNTKPTEPASKSESTEKKQIPAVTLEEAMEKLNKLIGLENIKDEIKHLLKSLEGQKMLEEQGGIKVGKPTLHMIFSGPTGSGKTEVARLLAQILHAAGFIKTNKLVETDRSGLVGEYAGQTAQKVVKKVEEALNGVLIVDAADALLSDDSFSKEAIETLLKELEDHREDVVVILAGYESEMETLLSRYPAFRTTVPHRLQFKDYTPQELSLIAKKMLEEKGFIAEQILATLEKEISRSGKSGSVEGNARFVRNFIERVISHHTIRILDEKPEDVRTITEDDVKKAASAKKSDKEREGLAKIKEQALEQLDNMVGLNELKTELKRIMNFFVVQKKKVERGMISSNPTMHMVFAGPPGTGKTTVARIMGQFLKGTGVLSNGHLKEVSRADLVGTHVGETAPKVKKVISECLGGILFIDEAYALASDDSFGKEAIDTLIKEMEDNRHNLVVILAGYVDEMAYLIDQNPGFRSRIAYQFDFPDYSREELFEITKINLSANGLVLDELATTTLFDTLKELDEIEGNGRWVRNFVDKLQITQSDRIVLEDSDDLSTIVAKDIIETMKYM